MMVGICRANGYLENLKLVVMALVGILCLYTSANAAGYGVTLVGYKGQLREIAPNPSLWDDIQSKWEMFLKRGKGNPMANVTSAKIGTLTKGDFSREVVRLVSASEEDAARMVKGMNGSIFRGDGLKVGFIRIGKEITLFEGPPAIKNVKISGYRGIMAEVSAFTAWFMVSHNEWAHFVDEHRCSLLADYGWEYATVGSLNKGDRRVSYVCVKLLTPETRSPCLRNTDRFIEDIKDHSLMVAQIGNKLMFMRGNVPRKDMLALMEAIPGVPGFDPQ